LIEALRPFDGSGKYLEVNIGERRQVIAERVDPGTLGPCLVFLQKVVDAREHQRLRWLSDIEVHDAVQ
jgi:hypothetical protein